MATIYITSECGELVAEVNGEKCYELTDCIYDLGHGFGEQFEVDYDTDTGDVWGLIDAMYALAA